MIREIVQVAPGPWEKTGSATQGSVTSHWRLCLGKSVLSLLLGLPSLSLLFLDHPAPPWSHFIWFSNHPWRQAGTSESQGHTGREGGRGPQGLKSALLIIQVKGPVVRRCC